MLCIWSFLSVTGYCFLAILLLPFVLEPADSVALPINGTLGFSANATNVTNVTHIHHHHHHFHHEATVHNLLVSASPVNISTLLPPLATTPPPTTTTKETHVAWVPATGLAPHYQHPHYDGRGKILWFPRIIGGTPANVGEFPAQVSLQYVGTGGHFCAGTLLTMKHILTAAHCVTEGANGSPIAVSKLQIMASDVSIVPTMASPLRQIRQVQSITVHPKYDGATFANDIAIVKVRQEFKKTDTLYPAKRIQRAPVAGDRCSVAGWGVVTPNATAMSPILQRINLVVIDFGVCNGNYQQMLPKGSMCAASPGRDACQGDSGGALNCQQQVAGIVSFGAGCAHPEFPGVYADVAHYEKWINGALKGAAVRHLLPSISSLLWAMAFLFSIK